MGCDHSKRLCVELSDKLAYSTTAKRWAKYVPTIGVPSKPTIDYVHTPRPTELQEWGPVFVGYVVVDVPRGAYVGGNAVTCRQVFVPLCVEGVRLLSGSGI